jgi:putative Mg2+ transporter-C (MgtC) family protein
MDHLFDDILKIVISFFVGALLGFEREYHDKPAGLRTIILITVGSTLFTMVSNSFDVNPERVASNIVTGIGFIGAGVMFRQGTDIKGITTAATVWLAAALGMAIAQEMYVLTAVVVVIVLGTLALMSKLEKQIFVHGQKKTYQITLNNGNSITELEELFNRDNIKANLIRVLKEDQKPVAVYKVSCGAKQHNAIAKALAESNFVNAFEV